MYYDSCSTDLIYKHKMLCMLYVLTALPDCSVIMSCFFLFLYLPQYNIIRVLLLSYFCCADELNNLINW
jgi:hypothetical protein